MNGRAATRIRGGTAAIVFAIAALTGCGAASNGGGSSPDTSGPMTPYKLAGLIIAADHRANTSNPLVNVTCDPQASVTTDGVGPYDCTETFQSGGESFPTVVVNTDHSWHRV